MGVKSLNELAEKLRNSPEMTPYPDSFARCLQEMTQHNPNGSCRGNVRSTSFVTASGLTITPSEVNRRKED